MEHKIKVLIVEDSPLYQAYLKRILGKDDRMEICGCVDTGEKTRALLKQERPDVITLDLQLPDESDFGLLKWIVEHYSDIPVIVVTSIPESCEKAIQFGAKDFIEKVQDGSEKSREQFALLLRLKIKMQARPVARQHREAVQPVKRTYNLRQQIRGRDHVIVIGASLGGTEATLQLLQALPEEMPGIVVVQHMPPGFTKAYALRLDRNCRLKVEEATDGAVVERGKVLIAKGGEQLTLCRNGNGYRVQSQGNEKVGGFCPSVNVLFESTAKVAGDAAVGVILTGLGRDGAQGMLQMHEMGAYNIGQNEASCVVYGMPAEAKRVGAIDRELPLEQIAEALIRHFER